MNHLEINASTRGGGVGLGITDMESFGDKWKEKLNEVAEHIDWVVVLAGGGCFWLRMECVEFLENYIPLGQF